MLADRRSVKVVDRRSRVRCYFKVSKDEEADKCKDRVRAPFIDAKWLRFQLGFVICVFAPPLYPFLIVIFYHELVITRHTHAATSLEAITCARITCQVDSVSWHHCPPAKMTSARVMEETGDEDAEGNRYNQ